MRCRAAYVLLLLPFLAFACVKEDSGPTDPDNGGNGNGNGGSVSGKTATFEGLSVTLLQSGDWQPGVDDLQVEPNPGNRFYTVQVAYVNSAGVQRTFNPFDFEIETSASTRLSPVPSWREPDLGSGNLASGDQVIGWVTFEIPIGQAAVRLLYSPRFDITLAIPI